MRREENLCDDDENTILLEQSIRSKIWTAIPAIIQDVNYTKFTVSVQPAIKGRIEDQNGDAQIVDLPLLTDVPIMLPNAGGWHLTFPIKAGDECLVVFSARCIDAWWQNGGIQQAMERRMQDLSDGFAILAPYSQPLAKECEGGFSDSSVILRDDKKENYIELTNDGKLNILHQSDLDADTLGNADIYIKGNATIKVDGNVDTTIKGNATIKVDGNVDITVKGDITARANNVTLNANTLTVNCPKNTFNGNIQVNGEVTVSQEVTAAGIALTKHKHTGVQGGSSNTGEPI